MIAMVSLVGTCYSPAWNSIRADFGQQWDQGGLRAMPMGALPNPQLTVLNHHCAPGRRASMSSDTDVA